MRVLLCDRAWPDASVERDVLEGAGLVVLEPSSTDEDMLVRDASDVVAIMTCFTHVTRRVIDAATDLRIVARLGTGVDMIDLAAAEARGVPVTNVPEYCTDEVAEHALGMAFALLREIVFLDRKVQGGGWGIEDPHPPRRARGRTLGIVGFGKIGRALAERATAVGMRVLVWSRRGDVPEIVLTGAAAASLDELLASADVVSLHLPLEDDTRGLVDESFVRRMRRGAVLVNTARGGLVDEGALVRALDDGHLAGAALDVLAIEPASGSPLVTHPRVIVTPHVAFYSPEGVAEMRRIACEDVVRVVVHGEDPRFRVT